MVKSSNMHVTLGFDAVFLHCFNFLHATSKSTCNLQNISSQYVGGRYEHQTSIYYNNKHARKRKEGKSDEDTSTLEYTEDLICAHIYNSFFMHH